MEHSDFQERTKRLKDTAYKLRDAVDVVLAEVQHMEAAQERFAERMKNGPRYAQRALAPEAFDRAVHPGGARVPAPLLRARLPQVSDIAARRLAREYPKECKSLAQMFTEDLTLFVEGCENAERKNGEPCLLKATY